MTKEEQWIKESIENHIFAYTGKRVKISDADAQHFTASVISYFNLCTPSLPSNLDEADLLQFLDDLRGQEQSLNIVAQYGYRIALDKVEAFVIGETDITGYMKRNIFGLPNGKLSIAFYDARKKVREILPKKEKGGIIWKSTLYIAAMLYEIAYQLKKNEK